MFTEAPEPEIDTSALSLAAPPALTPEVMPAAAVTSSPSSSTTAFASSPDISALVGGLAQAQLAFAAIDKNQTADVQSRREGARSYKYNYADLASVLAAVRPALASNGIALLQAPFARVGSIAVTTLIAHTSGQWIRNDLAMRLDATDPQALGSAITYLRRYALQALLGVAPEDDDDGAGASSKPAVQQPQRASAVPADVRGAAHAPSNGNGHPSPPRPPAPVVPATPSGLPLKRLQKKETAGGEPYWVMEFGDGAQAITFSTTWGGKLEGWFLNHVPLGTPKTHKGTGKNAQFTYLDDVQPIGGGR